MNINLVNLSFSYENNQVLDKINLSVKTDETVGIIGVSGGGKSTLLKLISGLYDIQAGSIVIGEAQASAERRKMVAMVMQSTMLFPASIRDNISCGHDMDESVLLRACEKAQLSEWICSLSDGIDTFVGERGGKVSGGQAQRIAIARAIAKNAPVILLDEPTSALDSDTGAAIMATLASLTEGKTVLHISHQFGMLSDCDRILRLDRGRLYAQ